MALDRHAITDQETQELLGGLGIEGWSGVSSTEVMKGHLRTTAKFFGDAAKNEAAKMQPDHTVQG